MVDQKWVDKIKNLDSLCDDIRVGEICCANELGNIAEDVASDYSILLGFIANPSDDLIDEVFSEIEGKFDASRREKWNMMAKVLLDGL